MENKEKLKRKIVAIGRQLIKDLENNDHYTSDPIVYLQTKTLSDGHDITYSDNKYWYNPETEETIYDTDPRASCDEDGDWHLDVNDGELQKLSEENGWNGPFGYIKKGETVMVALAQQGVDDYMAVNGHNIISQAHNGKYRTYIDPLHRCHEMIAIREFLMDYAKENSDEAKQKNIYIKISNDKIASTVNMKKTNPIVNLDFDKDDKMVGIEVVGPCEVSQRGG